MSGPLPISGTLSPATGFSVDIENELDITPAELVLVAALLDDLLARLPEASGPHSDSKCEEETGRGGLLE
jgi:hypothetical protein